MRANNARFTSGRIASGVFASLAVGLFTGAAGCGQVSPPDPGVPLDTAPQEIAATVCAKAYNCCTASELMGNDMAGTDEPSCEMKTATAFGNQLTAIKQSQHEGRVRYDGAKLMACLAYIRSATCDDLGTTNHFSGIPGCDSFVTPLVADGGECNVDWECTGGLCQSGHCAALPKAGDMCVDSKCGDGAACNSPTDMCVATTTDNGSCTLGTECPSGVCTGGTCTPRAKTCFYSSGCSVAPGGAVSALAIVFAAALMLAAARRRPAPARSVTACRR